MNRLLYISMSLEKSSYGGSIVSRANLQGLKANEHLEIKEVVLTREIENIYSWEILASKSKVQTALNNLKGFAGRLNEEIFTRIKSIVKEFQPTIVYLDSSLLGMVAQWCKKTHPTVKVVTFFHNVEYDFEMDRLKSGKLQFLPSLFATATAEKKAVKYSDVLITLHQTDSERLYQRYKRKADYYVPVCIMGEYVPEETLPHERAVDNKPFKIGFIGTAFYANTMAAEYISQKIAPHFLNDSSVQFVIAGNGFENYAEKLNKPNLKTSGYIDSLTDFYKDVDVILSPISIGGGMKVKVAEALKYNKKVIASSFTLIGYEQSLGSPDIIRCDSIDEYVAAIHKLKFSRHTVPETKHFFQKYYSAKACAEYFKEIFQ